jgi:hypothetical protein
MVDIIVRRFGQVTTFRATSVAGRQWLVDHVDSHAFDGSHVVLVGRYGSADLAVRLADDIEGDMERDGLAIE